MLYPSHHFFTHTLDQLLETSRTLPEQHVLSLFQEAAQHVPAYQAFLKEHGIKPKSIKEWSDFQSLPLVSKDNYLRRYPLNELCWEGELSECDFVAVSSGSTGTPCFWPRNVSDELFIATRFEQIFHDSFNAKNQRTLAVICFSLGTWVGGFFTAHCCRYLHQKGYPVTVVTPGNNLAEIFRVIKDLAPYFDQTVLLGYPPFLKDVIDEGIREKINWSERNIKLVMAGEVFSEEWRDVVSERAGIKDIVHGSSSLYGTADAAVLGNETPLSITIRRFLSREPDLVRELFGESRLPTLVQYDPCSRYFETHSDGTLIVSGNNGIPLLRYHIADNGGVIPYEQMKALLAKHGFNKTAFNLENTRQLPFVYVFGRSHFTVSFFGANIYPENITVGLEQPDIHPFVTGKFVLETREGVKEQPTLLIAVELAPGITASEDIKEAITQSILTQLLKLNSEFANYVPGPYQQPIISLYQTGDPAYFPKGVKHRYTRPKPLH